MKKLLFTVFVFINIFANAQEKWNAKLNTKASIKLEESNLKKTPLYVYARKLEEEYKNKVLTEWIKENDTNKTYRCPICYPAGPLPLGLGAIIAIGAINNPNNNLEEDTNIFHNRAEHKNIKKSDIDLELKKYIALLQKKIKE